MKCPSCGAELKNGENSCEFCGSQISLEMKKEQEQLNKVGCPKCKSTNVNFNREKQGEIKGKKGMSVVHSTVGVCKDCGHTWYVYGEPEKKKQTWLWVLGWILIFPLPLTILLLRPTCKMDKKLCYAIIAVAWLIYVVWMVGSQKNNTDSELNGTITTETGVSTDSDEKGYNAIVDNSDIGESIAKEAKATESHLYDNAIVKNLMNGPRTEKLGEYAVIKAKTSECTEEAIADIYYNYFEKNDFNWIALIYTDKTDSTGIYFNKSMVGVNDIFEEDEYGDYSVVTPDNEIIYVPSGDGKTLTKMEFEN